MSRSHETTLPEQEALADGMTGSQERLVSPGEKWGSRILSIWDAPVTWVRGESLWPPTRLLILTDFLERIVLPMRPATPPKYYHQKFPRVPTVEECYTDDVACIYEAHEQYKRDRKVDSRIIDILRMRWVECMRYHGHDQADRCEKMKQDFLENETNWFIKCELRADKLAPPND